MFEVPDDWDEDGSDFEVEDIAALWYDADNDADDHNCSILRCSAGRDSAFSRRRRQVHDLIEEGVFILSIGKLELYEVASSSQGETARANMPGRIALSS